MRTAVLDLGSNSTRLLIADVDDGRIREVLKRSTVTRLAQGVDGSGRLDDDAVARVLEALDDYTQMIADHGAERAIAVMTSAVRDAANGQEFAERISDGYDFDARILTGDDEARLTFAGATSERPPDDHVTRLVIDIGGGSTEFVVGTGHEMSFHTSTQVGVVRHSERHLHTDPPQADELQAISTDVRATFADAIPPTAISTVKAAIAVAGTATSCAALVQRLQPYDSKKVEGYVLTLTEIEALLARLSRMNEAERRQQPGLHPDRAATIVPGIVLLAESLRAFGLDRTEVSEHDLLRGVALTAEAKSFG
ncbi:MAG TPA: Ppx/GppA phosphatase family protein [Baekduia sp.]|nr:Ppx/GppA phosphatase family protein [Baekduia sp.]